MKRRMFNITPSLMCADLLQMGDQVRELERAGARSFHVDVMDGHFVPNLGLNFDLVRQLKRMTNAQIDVHLMVEDPGSYVDKVQALKVDSVSFHIEAARAPLRLLRAMKAAGARTGIAFNPSTSIQSLHYVLEEFDYVVVMAVEPGFAGQKFIPTMYEKIRTLREILDKVRPGIGIEVDGNLDVETSTRCIQRGATTLVGGSSSVFRPGKDVFSAYTEFKEGVSKACKRQGITQRVHAWPEAEI
jgi:ribulose-phosphate 3-epimerase